MITVTKPGGAKGGVDAAWPRTGVVEFKNVWMKYNPTAPFALKGVSFRMEHGEKVGGSCPHMPAHLPPPPCAAACVCRCLLALSPGLSSAPAAALAGGGGRGGAPSVPCQEGGRAWREGGRQLRPALCDHPGLPAWDGCRGACWHTPWRLPGTSPGACCTQQHFPPFRC